HVRAGPAETLVVVHGEVRAREVDDRRRIPLGRIVYGGVLGGRPADARLPRRARRLVRLARAVAVAPAEVLADGAFPVLQEVDLEERAALVHVAEELEERGVDRTAGEDVPRLPDGADRPRLVRLDDQVARVDGEDAVEDRAEL